LDEFNEPVSINLSFSDLDGFSEEERACYLLNRQEGSRLGGQRCGSSMLDSASSFEDLHLSDDLFDDAVMLCDVVHEGSVKTTLSALQSLKKGHGLFSLMKTISKNNTLTDITNAASLGGLKMSEEDRTLCHQHDETKSIASILAMKSGNKLSSLMSTIAKNNTLTDITNATSLGVLKMSEEDRALLHQHDETKSIASILAIKSGHRMSTIAKNNTLTDITNATSLGDLKMSEEDRALLHQHDETKSIASLFAIKREHNYRMASEGVTVDGKSKKSLTMTRNRETKRQEELERLGSKRLFCGYCGETNFFKEGSRVRGGTCLESCYSRDYGFARHYHSEWKVTKPSQKEMNALNEYRARK
jgi:hypothetical protein